MQVNREEKSLRHVAMVAKCLDDIKPIKSIHTVSNFKFSLAPYLSLSKFRKRKRQFLCCVHLLDKEMYKIARCTCKVVVC